LKKDPNDIKEMSPPSCKAAVLTRPNSTRPGDKL